MNTTQLKRFAQEARKKMINLVSGKLEAVLTQDSAALREKAVTIKKLEEDINKYGREILIDKVAYTWFNRLIALRFMDANDFQPLGINVLSPAHGVEVGSPQILSDIQAGFFPEELKLDRQYINDILNGVIASSNPDNDIYRHVLIAVCNDLHQIFPFLFERLDDYSELLLPDDLTSPFSIVADIVNGMSVEDCQEVEIIGWLYQFYISEKKDEVFASNKKVKKEDIPAATQLFTPRWIVEYMVQNTVGKLWLQNHPKSSLKQYMPYYIEPVDSNSEDYLKINSAEEIKLLDQACGSGHILVYGFELFAKIYEEQGYNSSDIPSLIIKNNLFGLEIDERAAQLAAFAITMKARQYYRRFFRKPAKPHILCYVDLKFTEEEIVSILAKYKITNKEAFKYDLRLLEQATNLGSLIQPHTDLVTLEAIQKQLEEESESSDLFWQQTQNKLYSALHQLIPLVQKYHCVVQNPPYMGVGKYNKKISSFINTNYFESKADLFSCFIERSISISYSKGLIGTVTMESWMFLSSFEKFRKNLLEKTFIENLSHFGWHIMRIAFGTVAFILKNQAHNGKDEGIYNYLPIEDVNLEIDRPFSFPNKVRRYSIKNQKDFEKIPGNNIGYWLCDRMLDIFTNNIPLSKIGEGKVGLQTGDNNRFLRIWSEINANSLKKDALNNLDAKKSGNKWFPYNKAGEFRRWYGNQYHVVNWEDNGNEIKNFVDVNGKPRSVVRNPDFYFLSSISWGLITSGGISFRYYPSGFIYDVAGMSYFPYSSVNKWVLLGALNSNIIASLNKVLNPTINLQIGDVIRLPFLDIQNSNIEEIVIENVNSCLLEWNIRETSWDFLKNELLRLKEENVQSSVNLFKEFWQNQFFILHQHEEELNSQFIKFYGLQNELSPDVHLGDITILKDELKRRKVKRKNGSDPGENNLNNESWSPEWVNLDLEFRKNGYNNLKLPFNDKEIIAQLISYAVGCIFGRYSLDKEGLILANQGETIEDYLQKVAETKENLQFVPDEDNVIPVLDEEWFDDDIVNRVKDFIRAVWGGASYNDNIQYMEETLGKELRKYLIKDFYKDHIKRYKKRPIYWMFSSPKSHFNVLIYMHRYTPDTLNLILNSYLRPFMEKVRSDLKMQEDIIIAGTAVEQGRARKRQDKLKSILQDCESYEYDILFPLAGERIAIDLDDGVLVNYNKIGDAITSVAGLNDAKTKEKVRKFDWIDTSTIK